MTPAHYDPWTRVRTFHDLPADEVISALQKEIRRGHAENAAVLAYEMLITSSELERKLWDRLCVISAEDVGFGELQAPILVTTLWDLAQRFHYGEGDRNLFAIHAVRYLATRPKDRSSDEMLNWIRRAVDRDQGLRPTIPDYAIDMHTARGQAMGRDQRHFWEVGSRVCPEVADRDTTYRQRVLKMLGERGIVLTGHRGAAKLEPENTLRAMRKAIALGVDQIELDVHLTRDQQLVVMHDDKVDRTTNGHGPVGEFSLEELRQLDAGQGERVPTLQEVIDLVGDRAVLQIELKGEGTAAPTVRLIEANGLADKVLFTSFAHERLREVRQLNPRIRLAALWVAPPPDVCQQALDMGAEAIHIQHQHITPEVVRQVHESGLQIRAWNPDTEEEILRVADLGVDAIGSNRPDLLVKLLR
jgi:glycerophosphoryl diester phosphodiesterase